MYLLYNAQINVEEKQMFYQHLQRKGYICISVGALVQPEREGSLQSKFEGQDYSKIETRMHSSNDFANRRLCHLNLLSLSLENQGIIWQWGKSYLFELNASYIGPH